MYPVRDRKANLRTTFGSCTYGSLTEEPRRSFACGLGECARGSGEIQGPEVDDISFDGFPLIDGRQSFRLREAPGPKRLGVDCGV
jgi:hypothetical protein